MTSPSQDGCLELGRLERLRGRLAEADCAAGVFFDPINIRYATGVSNMQVYSLHNPCRYVFVPVAGPVVLFDFKGCAHLSADRRAVDEVREAVSWYHFVAGSRCAELAGRWADEIVDLLGCHRQAGAAAGHERIAVDWLDHHGFVALERRGIDVIDGQEVAGLARMIKTEREISVIREAMAVCEASIARMAAALDPGVTEQALWSVLHQATIESGGEWFETRLLTSGPRTNPWYQECSNREIENGDLVAFDTDLIGIGGYAVDISRTWLAGDRRASDVQCRMYEAAYRQVTTNIELLQPGTTFRELSERAHVPPGPLHSPTNACIAHGVGLCNEYPLVLNRDHFGEGGYDGVIQAGMVFCVESLIAPTEGREAVKLEEQVLVTPSGPTLLSSYPHDERLLN